MKQWMQLFVLSCVVLVSSCTIEPPLHLAQQNVLTEVPIVTTELDVIWQVDAGWRTSWWYGWDDQDERMWGKLEYPIPSNYEVRRYYQGSEQSNAHKLSDAFTVYGSRFKLHYDFGYHDMLFWSNIDSPDGTQTVLINESDPDAIIATTTGTSATYRRVGEREIAQKNQPDIFYSGYERDFYISRNIEDYDYYDTEEGAWVKMLHATLDPMVYIYLVQVAVYNNNGRVSGLAESSVITGMSEGVVLNTGRTLNKDVNVAFDMRMKKDLQARDGKPADILGSKFTTYGLCDIAPWRISRAPQYAGSRADLTNNITLDLLFSNATDSIYTYDVTKQVQRQIHGGILTIEIDADTLTIPRPGGGSHGAGFNPTVDEYDSKEHEFTI